LLGVAQVGRHDHFFELGGHSLLAIQLVSALRRTLGREVPLGRLFEHPTLAGFAATLDDSTHSTLGSVVPADRSAALPLSWAQQRLWFLDQLDPAAGLAYHIPAALRLQGTLDVAALQATLDRIVARHESLRTCFVQGEDGPVQQFAPETIGFALEQVDLSALSHDAQQAVVEQRSAQEALAPFDLAVGPLIRGQLLRLSAQEHVLLVTQHHIVSDGWSIGVMIGEVTALYEAFSQGQPDPLPPLAIQYADYALWQRQWLQGEALQQQLGFWREHLSGAPALLELPTDRPRPAVQSYAGGRVEVVLQPELVKRLRSFSQHHGTTVFMTLLSGWALLMSRLSGQGEVVIGTPVANRQRAEIEPLIGFFVNTLALRVNVQAASDVAGLLAQVKATALAGYAHQDVPFEQVVDTLQPSRSLSHGPLFQTIFALNNTPSSDASVLPGITFDRIATPESHAAVDLGMSLEEVGDVIQGQITFASALLDAQTVERWFQHYATLLEGFIADDRCAPGRVPLLTTQQHLLLDSFNPMPTDYPRESLLHLEFEKLAATQPDRAAVVEGDTVVSYSTVNQRANQVARHLLSVGVQPGDRVAISLPRGIDLVVGLLSILKAGAVYVPIDPSYPSERIAYMLADSAPTALVTADALLACFPDTGMPRVCLEREEARIGAYDDSNLHCPHPTSPPLAYVIYTSGSTGQPKGVMLHHRSVLRLVMDRSYLDIGPEDCLAHCANPAFDAAAWEIWVTLLAGARLLVVPQSTLLDGEAFRSLLLNQAVTILHLTVGLFNQYAPTLADVIPRLRCLLFGGEQSDVGVVSRVMRDHPPGRLVHCYGPTETTTFTATHTVSGGLEGSPTVPIGRPLANTRIYLLDGEGQRVPVGVRGEINIAGEGVALGYLNRPELTAERFIADPFAADRGARMYRSGDMGRWRVDGTLEYLGRNDYQVKIRGFRIELGEIEMQLAACPGVREAVVLAYGGDAGDKHLVAYVIAQADAMPTPETLRGTLSQSLPEYMLPSAYVALDAWPLTENGKLDRRALPPPDHAAIAGTLYEAPVTDAEQQLARVWSRLLGRERVGRQDNFFELGGHSLLVVQMIAALQREGWRTDVKSAFANRTLADMARVLEPLSDVAGPVPFERPTVPPGCHRISPDMVPLADISQVEIDRIVAAAPGGVNNIQDIYPLTPMQEGILFHHLLGEGDDAYLLRFVLGFDSRERLEGFLAALQTLVQRHDILRTAIHWQQIRQPVQVVHRHAQLRLVEVAADGADARERLLAISDPQCRTFDLTQAPLLEAFTAFDMDRGEYVLALLHHHVVCDHVSMHALLDEIGLLLDGDAGELAPPTPYRELVVHSRATPGELHERYFRGVLGKVDTPTLPFDALEVMANGQGVVEVRNAVASDVSRRVRTCASRQKVSPSVLFHAAWAMVAARCTAQDTVVFGTVLSGRMQGARGHADIVGMSLNTLPLCVSLGSMSATGLLGAVHESVVVLLEHEHASLALAQRCSGVAPPLPLFNSLFNYRHVGAFASDGEASESLMAGVRVIDAKERTNYPITISVNDAADGSFGLVVQAGAGIDAERVAAYLLTSIEVLVSAVEEGNPEEVAELDILPATERDRLLRGFNPPITEYPRTALLHAAFERNARVQPEAVAVEDARQRVTYGSLNRRANQMAHYLIQLGVGPGTRVAICLERGPDMVAGVLAILKAGGAYVPLDPDYPLDRLVYMLEDSAPAVLLTDALLQARWPDLSMPVVRWDGDADAIAACAADDPDPVRVGANAADLAYVIYTSGSTGLPKGVMVQHRPVVNLVDWVNRTFLVGPSDRLLFTTSLCFDLSVYDIFGMLAAGGVVRIASKDEVADPRRLLDILYEEEVTFWDSAPAVFGQLSHMLETGRAGNGHLRLAFFSGDWIPLDLPVALRRAFPECQVVALGGATEATVWSNYHQVVDADPAWSSVPYGRPIQNATYHVLDERLRPCPVGVAGDLYIGGECLSAGYFRRPALTAERYIRSPFAMEPDARLYRTGDRARYWADGTLEFLGRLDSQVKIRGFRIELGEIEAQLLACAGIREAVVVAREERAGDRRLVAYLIAEDGAEPVPAVLRDALARRLPEYMLPSAFVMLAAWPLTANGKLDRAALPAVDAAAVATRGHEAPVSEIEVQVAGIWAELLGLERVGRQDNFFALGGHSLLATQVVSAVRRLLGWEVPLGQVFRHPTLAAFAACVEESAPSTLEALVPAVRPEVLPLSWAQQRLWFLDQLDPAASAAYHMPAALRLQGALDRAALQAALDRVVARHEGLRARFVSSEDGPVQQFAPDSIGFTLQYRDLGELAPAAQAEAVAEAGRWQTQSPFDLTTGPLIRGQLLRLSAQEHVLLVTQHHIVSDGWSIGVMIGEVTALYAAFSQGQPDPLPPLAIQYADYALWQRQWLQGEALQQQLGFWREHLSGAPALLELPTDRPRPAVQSYAGGNVAFTLPAPLVERLHALSHRHGTTLFMTLLGGWALLMSRLSGQGEVVIGTPVANRQRAEIEPLIGFFVNTLALRVNVQAASDVAGLLAQVKATALAGYTHQDVAFEQVVEALQPTRSLGHSPVFQTMVSLNNTPVRGAAEVPGLVLSPLESQQTTTQFDLSLSLIEADEVLEGGLEYASDLFDAATVQRWCAHLVKVLEAMVADDRQAVAAVPLLADFERDQLVRAFNQTASAPVEAATVQALFERQVQQAPSAVAVIHEDRAVSYAELNRQSNQLAHQLIGLGVGPEHRVALCMERGVEMVVGLLGILKAGAGYVPLDPAYPRERLAYIVQDSAPTAILSHIGLPAAVHDWLQTVAPAQVVLGDAATMERLGALPEHDPAVASDAHDLAYVIHTSGSTGRPKGVLVEHHSMVNLVAAHVRRCGLGRDDRVLQFASMSFDASVEEIFAPLAAGATLVLRPSLLPPDSTFSQYLRDQRISIVELPTAFWHYWVGDAGFEQGLAQTCARLVVIGGEKASADSVARWHHACARHPCQLLNTYGPTEATVYATATLLEPACMASSEPSIGRPIANTQVHVLDAWQQVQPLGVVGEIHIGGQGVARGYLNQPALTAERFIADPFSTDPQARLYRTGDLGRWRADGTLEYVGRNDFQVKIRGFRIELGEIESRLRACAGVREAVVLAREDRPGDPRLVAYVQADTGAMPAAAALREALSVALPDYMVPGAYVTVDAWPVNASGKLDRRALPAPDAAAVAKQAYEAPATATEARVAEVWSALLGVARIGRHDHFFELGGHSLLATQLVAALRRTIGREVPLRRVFEQPTLSGFCTALAGSAGSRLGELLPMERTGALPLSWAQQRLWFLDQLDPAASLAYHMPTALRLEGPLDGAALQATLDRIVARHESLRTYFVQTVDGPVQRFAPDTVGFALTQADLSGLTVDMQQVMVEQ
ncbi:amino acid adenylation domain-containing protein, partial [Xanthomonas melonis]